jgi:hypothetical protein
VFEPEQKAIRERFQELQNLTDHREARCSTTAADEWLELKANRFRWLL